jgi:outer membrane immunogenic protein
VAIRHRFHGQERRLPSPGRRINAIGRTGLDVLGAAALITFFGGSHERSRNEVALACIASNNRVLQMKKLTLVLAAASCLVAGQAIADGYARKAAACCEAPRMWTGFYIGAGAGSGAVVHDLTVNVPAGSLLDFDGIGGQGYLGTVIVGYDQQISSNMVVGIFSDYDFSNISSDLSALGGAFNASLAHKHTWSIGGRAGLLSSPSTLWYGTAGYTQAKFDLTSTIGSLNVPEFKGYFVGGGVESQIAPGWSVRAEYRYSQFDRESVFNVPAVIDVGLEPSMHTTRLSLTYKFGRREEAPVPLK